MRIRKKQFGSWQILQNTDSGRALSSSWHWLFPQEKLDRDIKQTLEGLGVCVCVSVWIRFKLLPEEQLTSLN